MATTVIDQPGAPRADRPASPDRTAGRPRYERPALLLIAVAAAVLYAWGIGHSQYHTFYANAARSMSESWKAFFYGSFDPANSITLDKVPGFLWPQALCARILGFHPWTLALPQAVEGVASVLVLHRLVRGWAGAGAALTACAAFLLTPAAVGVFRTAVEDAAFTLCLLLAAEATRRAALGGRVRPLLWAGVWVGLAFQAKMLEAWAVLPALAVTYVLSAPVALRRRLAHLALSGLVMTAVSASWMLAVALTPAADRPYVDGTTDNSAFGMVVGYNFLNRFSSLGVSAAATGSVSATQGGGGHGGDGRGERHTAPGADRGADARTGGERTAAPATAVGGPAAGPGGAAGAWGSDRKGWLKMFDPAIAVQTGWLYPFAALALVCGVLWRRGRPRTDPLRAGFVLWGTWLATFFLVFSAGSIGGHTYYMGVIAAPLAALTGGGAALLRRAHRGGGRRALVLPGAVAATAAWSAYLASGYSSFLAWPAPAVAVLGLAAAMLLLAARPGRGRFAGRIAVAGGVASVAAVLTAPGVWTAQVFDPAAASSAMGAVGPAGGSGQHGPRPAAAPAQGAPASGAGADTAPSVRAARSGQRTGRAAGGGGPLNILSGEDQLSADQRKLLTYTRAHQGRAAYVFATTGWNGASPYILGAGARVLPLGGFSGRVPFPTEAGFRNLVDTGRLRYVLVGGGRGLAPLFGGDGAPSTAERITARVRSDCSVVPASAYGAGRPARTATATAGGAAAAPGGTAAAPQTLYRCDPGRLTATAPRPPAPSRPGH
ncbi:ArnT family glycosyltransferase [Streptomyces sp. PsTaAH-124]|uniref:ArnT family glycosyltransferase n=1 Tax=Streptomyces sp. PsTaAH-124 TaxID=1157638 RepID=UPI00036AE442|nr:glycosyltransferase family 39 protein [Streptomyces sp. PsTaAH-124]